MVGVGVLCAVSAIAESQRKRAHVIMDMGESGSDLGKDYTGSDQGGVLYVVCAVWRLVAIRLMLITSGQLPMQMIHCFSMKVIFSSCTQNVTD